MEERFGVRGNVENDVFFTESSIPQARLLRTLKVEIRKHNATLFDVKQALAADAKAAGANAVVGFRYGQKAKRGLKLLWNPQDIIWYGEGDAVSLHDS